MAAINIGLDATVSVPSNVAYTATPYQEFMYPSDGHACHLFPGKHQAGTQTSSHFPCLLLDFALRFCMEKHDETGHQFT
jgi:hypothetical protein